MAINLDRDDKYETKEEGEEIVCVVPDESIEETMKVLRSVRDYALHPHGFDAEAAVVLSNAHKILYDMVLETQRIDSKEAKNAG